MNPVWPPGMRRHGSMITKPPGGRWTGCLTTAPRWTGSTSSAGTCDWSSGRPVGWPEPGPPDRRAVRLEDGPADRPVHPHRA